MTNTTAGMQLAGNVLDALLGQDLTASDADDKIMQCITKRFSEISNAAIYLVFERQADNWPFKDEDENTETCTLQIWQENFDVDVLRKDLAALRQLGFHVIDAHAS
jgi:hypothetical protein